MEASKTTDRTRPLQTRDTQSVTIRRGKVTDFPGIVKCYWRDPEVPWDPYARVETLQSLVGPKGFLVAESRGKLVAFLHYRIFKKRPWFDPRVRRYGQILELHVLPGFRSKGIGRGLMTKALERLDRAHCNSVYVHTDDSNKASLTLYEGLGFKPFLATHFLRRKIPKAKASGN